MNHTCLRDRHTFVICAYKESPYLEECIQSLLSQSTVSNIIMFTSTPNESINRLAHKYDIMVYTSKGKGIGGDWNSALSFATTRYVTIAHQDDIYLSDYTRSIMELFDNYPQRWIAFSNYSEIRDRKVLNPNINLKIKDVLLAPLRVFPKSRFAHWFSIAFGSSICCPAVTYDLNQLNRFTFSESMKVSLDWDAWIRIYQQGGQFGYSSRRLMYHRIHSESETTNMIANNIRSKEDLEMFDKLWPKCISRFIVLFYKKSQLSNQ